VSTASLLIGVASAHATRSGILIAGIAGLVAGGMAMAAGEYVSVSSQADTERADLAVESKGLEDDRESEREELAVIYVKRGLDARLARKVAEQLMAHDALAAHARDELGINETLRARPLQAALASATSFTAGAAIPLLTAVLILEKNLVSAVGGVSLVSLALLGGLAAWVGGASIRVGAARVLLWGALAMGLTALVGSSFVPPTWSARTGAIEVIYVFISASRLWAKSFAAIFDVRNLLSAALAFSVIFLTSRQLLFWWWPNAARAQEQHAERYDVANFD
jgi:vacuolar iron transporter family protein